MKVSRKNETGAQHPATRSPSGGQSKRTNDVITSDMSWAEGLGGVYWQPSRACPEQNEVHAHNATLKKKKKKRAVGEQSTNHVTSLATCSCETSCSCFCFTRFPPHCRVMCSARQMSRSGLQWDRLFTSSPSVSRAEVSYTDISVSPTQWNTNKNKLNFMLRHISRTCGFNHTQRMFRRFNAPETRMNSPAKIK